MIWPIYRPSRGEWWKFRGSVPTETVPDLRDRGLIAMLNYPVAQLGEARKMNSRCCHEQVRAGLPPRSGEIAVRQSDRTNCECNIKGVPFEPRSPYMPTRQVSDCSTFARGQCTRMMGAEQVVRCVPLDACDLG